MNLVDHLEEITNAPSMEALWDLHCRKMADYGFDRLFYGYTNYRLGKSLGDPDDFIILTNHSKDYTDSFLGQEMYFHAPMVKWSLENEGWASWGMITDMLRWKDHGGYRLADGADAGHGREASSPRARRTQCRDHGAGRVEGGAAKADVPGGILNGGAAAADPSDNPKCTGT